MKRNIHICQIIIKKNLFFVEEKNNKIYNIIYKSIVATLQQLFIIQRYYYFPI